MSDANGDRSRNKSSDLWIESHQKLGQHPKMKRCARTLGISWVQMVGHLQYLWWWALDFATEGDVSDYDAFDLADAAMWEGDAATFYRALTDCGFIEDTGAGVVLHDWHDYAGKLLEAREKQAEKSRRFREAQKAHRSSNGNEPANDDVYNRKEPLRNGDVTGTQPARNSLTVTVTQTDTVTDNTGGAVLDFPAPDANASKPAPTRTTTEAVSKTLPPRPLKIPDQDAAWWAEEVERRAERAGINPATMLAEIDVGDQTDRWRDFQPAKGKAKPTWRNWMRGKIDLYLADLESAPIGGRSNGNGGSSKHESAADRQARILNGHINAIAAGNLSPQPAEDPHAGRAQLAGPVERNGAYIVDVTPRSLG